MQYIFFNFEACLISLYVNLLVVVSTYQSTFLYHHTLSHDILSDKSVKWIPKEEKYKTNIQFQTITLCNVKCRPLNGDCKFCKLTAVYQYFYQCINFFVRFWLTLELKKIMFIVFPIYMSLQHVHFLSVEVRRGDMPFALKLELQMILSFYLRVGNLSLVLWKSNQCS